VLAKVSPARRQHLQQQLALNRQTELAVKADNDSASLLMTPTSISVSSSLQSPAPSSSSSSSSPSSSSSSISTPLAYSLPSPVESQTSPLSLNIISNVSSTTHSHRRKRSEVENTPQSSAVIPRNESEIYENDGGCDIGAAAGTTATAAAAAAAPAVDRDGQHVYVGAEYHRLSLDMDMPVTVTITTTRHLSNDNVSSPKRRKIISASEINDESQRDEIDTVMRLNNDIASTTCSSSTPVRPRTQWRSVFSLSPVGLWSPLSSSPSGREGERQQYQYDDTHTHLMMNFESPRRSTYFQRESQTDWTDLHMNMTASPFASPFGRF
jgi:hypothetical protein